MDRLICGDVGFGKTEVALRAAFAVALDGKQVAVVVPTTLLARQHSKNFTERFQRLSRSMSRRPRAWSRPKQLTQVKKGLDRRQCRHRGRHPCAARQERSSSGTSACLIVDEEQHFGVSHKERLKQLRAQVHVLTLSAPRRSRARCSWR